MNSRTIIVTIVVVLISVAAVVIPYHDTDAVGTDAAPSYIGGSSATIPVSIYTDGTPLEMQIQYNLEAFGKPTAVFTAGIYDEGSDSYKALPAGLSVDVTHRTVAGIDTGHCDVVVTASEDTDAGNVNVHIRLTLTEEVSPGLSVDQTYVWAVNLNVVNNTGSIAIDGTPVTSDTVIDFAFETPYRKEVTVMKDGSEVSGYTFYVTGLPGGIALTSTDVIGGRIHNASEAGSSGTATIHAVSESGRMMSAMFQWTVGSKAVAGDFTYAFNGEGQASAYVVTSGTAGTLTIESDADHTVGSLKVLLNGNEVTGSGNTREITVDGTGTSKVTMVCDIVDSDGNSVVVTKTFTVYSVGSVVDSDLDPTVISS